MAGLVVEAPKVVFGVDGLLQLDPAENAACLAP